MNKISNISQTVAPAFGNSPAAPVEEKATNAPEKKDNSKALMGSLVGLAALGGAYYLGKKGHLGDGVKKFLGGKETTDVVTDLEKNSKNLDNDINNKGGTGGAGGAGGAGGGNPAPDADSGKTVHSKIQYGPKTKYETLKDLQNNIKNKTEQLKQSTDKKEKAIIKKEITADKKELAKIVLSRRQNASLSPEETHQLQASQWNHSAENIEKQLNITKATKKEQVAAHKKIQSEYNQIAKDLKTEKQAIAAEKKLGHAQPFETLANNPNKPESFEDMAAN